MAPNSISVPEKVPPDRRPSSTYPKISQWITWELYKLLPLRWAFEPVSLCPSSSRSASQFPTGLQLPQT